MCTAVVWLIWIHKTAEKSGDYAASVPACSKNLLAYRLVS